MNVEYRRTPFSSAVLSLCMNVLAMSVSLLVDSHLESTRCLVAEMILIRNSLKLFPILKTHKKTPSPSHV